MKLFNDEKTTRFWVSIMDKLSKEYDKADVGYGLLMDLCYFFDFEFGFIYQTNHKDEMLLDIHYKPETSKAVIPEKLDFEKLLGNPLYNILLSSKMIVARTLGGVNELEKKMAKCFNTPNLVLFPIIGEENQPLGAIGLGDRRLKRRNEDFNYQFAYSVFIMISNYLKLRRNQIIIEHTEKALESIADNMGVDIYVNDFNTHEILYLNRSMAEPYGGVQNVVGKKCFHALYVDKQEQCEYCPQRKLIDEEGKPTKVYSWDYQRPFDGTWFRVLSAAFTWVNGKTAHIVSSINITEQKRTEESIKKIAEFDMLTQLPNRYKMFFDMNTLVTKGKEFYVIIFDLNKFKLVNDKYGHRMGDELLKVIGHFLNRNEMTKGSSYRYGGDEFVILVETKSKGQATKIAKAIGKRAKSPWAVQEERITCTTSIGISMYPEDAKEADELLKCADKAMYEVKKKEGGISLFNQGKMVTIEWFNSLFL